MKFFQKLFSVSLVMVMCIGGMVSIAGAEPDKSAVETGVSVQMVKKIVLFQDWVSQEERSRYASEWEPYGVSAVMDLPSINGLVLRVPSTITSADLADDDRVVSVEGDQPVTLQAISATADGGSADGGSADGGSTNFITPVEAPPNDERPWSTLDLYDLPYDPLLLTDVFNRELLPQVIEDTITSENIHKIRVAILDTGVDPTHQMLKMKIAGGVDFMNMTEGIPIDDNGHGTHVAGTLCGHNFGMIPYSPLQLYAVKVLDHNAVGDVSTLLMGVQWCIDNGMDIINMSVAYAENSVALYQAIQEAYGRGIVMVAAAGNHSNWDDEAPDAAADGGSADGGSADGGSADGGSADGGSADGGSADGGSAEDETSDMTSPYSVMYPAKYPEVIAVAAVDSFGELASFSNYGEEVDLLAPGTNVVSTNIGGGFGICSGTSMAVPHVTASAAMLLALDLNLTPLQIKNILVDTINENEEINLIEALETVEAR